MVENIQYLNAPKDVSEDFLSTQANYFFFSRIIDFDTYTLTGRLLCKRYRRKLRLSFNQEMNPFEETVGWEFPDDYHNDKIIRFSITPFKDGTIRLYFDANKANRERIHEVPLVIEKMPESSFISVRDIQSSSENSITFVTEDFIISITYNPFKLIIKNKTEGILYETISIHEKIGIMNDNPIPCGFIQSTNTEERKFVYSSFLRPGEKLFGCGESFTKLDKRGQKLNISSNDPKGVSTMQMYKPIPFYLSNNRYACLIHSSCPITFDFGHSYDGVQSLFVDEDCLDMFIFGGSPKTVLLKYTELTGRSPMLPAWSFGLWMGRITYNSQKQVEDVARKLKKFNIPCDVIHLDTGWFSQEWRCDFIFDKLRFPNLKDMFKYIHDNNLHISLWQLPYMTPQNGLFDEIIRDGYAVTDSNGDLPTEDAILDFSNPKTVEWYQQKLGVLLSLGVDTIKADFGEEAPYNGIYHSGKSGKYEHNLYPLRYNKAVSDVTQNIKQYPLIWARSAWAGSQRYPLHWGGDAENTNNAMASTLRAGLSLGLCGFSFWSHDIGGFVKPAKPDLYLRWLAFGMFTSHARCHGNPPREPWDYSVEFMDEFRRLVQIRYDLMPYILKEAELSSKSGWPMIRPLFFEYPSDKTTWTIEDEYFFGSKLLVAPIFADMSRSRDVYLPAGNSWEDFFTGEVYSGGTWQSVSTDNYIVVLKKAGDEIQ